MLSESDLYSALALQHQLELGPPEPDSISRPITRTLPASIARRWKILPFRVAAGELHLAATDIPNPEMERDIRRFSSLEIRVQLIQPFQFDELAELYLRGRAPLLPAGPV